MAQPPKSSMPTEVLAGLVDRVTFHNSENGFGVLRVKARGQRCARDFTVEPATLVRAARVFAAKEPKFAAEIGLLALKRLLDRSGYDPGASLIQEAFGHLTGAASRISAQAWAMQQAQRLAEGPCDPSRSHMQRVLAGSLARWSEEPDGN